MKWLVNVLARARARLQGAYRTEWVEDPPERPKPRVVYIVGGREYPFDAAFVCPRGCGELLQVDISPKQRKSWRVSEHEDGTISLSPSVRLTKECGCHFWLRRGRIVWCEAPPSQLSGTGGAPGNCAGVTKGVGLGRPEMAESLMTGKRTICSPLPRRSKGIMRGGMER